ncbi:unnamed protein product, partial [marine sediment metagenome]
RHISFTCVHNIVSINKFIGHPGKTQAPDK